MRPDSHPTSRIDIIDGLRGIAILHVAWFHFWQLSWQGTSFRIFGRTLSFDFIPVTGFVGVDLFFFISGFCLMYPYAKANSQQRRAPEAKEFYLRRFWKIVPSYVFCILITLVFRWNEYEFTTPIETAKVITSHLVFAQNLNPGWSRAINSALWSLGVEVQFYLAFPLLIRIFLKYPIQTWVLGCAFDLAVKFSISGSSFHQLDLWLNQLPSVLALFLSGMLACHLYCERNSKEIASGVALVPSRRATWTSMAMFGLFLVILYTGFVCRYREPGYMLWQLHIRLPLALLFMAWVLSSFEANPWLKALLSNRVLIFFSTISYNFYLWHTVIARQLWRRGIPMSRTTDHHQDLVWMWRYFWICWAVSIAVSVIVTYGFERPILRWGHRRMKETST